MQFTSNPYVLVLSASQNFNIHLERSGGGYLSLSRRTSGEGWDEIYRFPKYGVIDVDVANGIEREYKVVSESAPTKCVITFADGTVEDVEIPAPSEPSDAPSGYETFECADGAFEVTDGYYYVKL